MAARKTTKTDADSTVEVKEETTAAAAERKPAAKKTAAKKTTAKTTTTKKTTTRKTTAKKAVVSEVHIQFAGKSILADDLTAKVKTIWKEEMGEKESALKDLKVYVNTDENTAYYVINGDVMGSFEM